MRCVNVAEVFDEVRAENDAGFLADCWNVAAKFEISNRLAGNLLGILRRSGRISGDGVRGYRIVPP